MRDAAVFKASYADWKLIKTRGVVQIVLEVPLSESDHAYQVVGGMPNSASERWFGIARLNDGTRPSEAAGADAPAERPAGALARLEVMPPAGPYQAKPVDAGADQSSPQPDRPHKPRKPVAAEKKLAMAAGRICAEPAFQRFLAETGLAPDMSEHDAADTVRDFCGVVSRAEIVPGSRAAELFIDLRGKYEAWTLIA